MQTLDEYYLTFGRDVVKEVERRLDEDGSLIPILKKLGMPALPGLHNQHRTLSEFMFRYGVFIFLKASQGNISGEEIHRMKMAKLMGTPTLVSGEGGTPGPVVHKIKPVQPKKREMGSPIHITESDDPRQPIPGAAAPAPPRRFSGVEKPPPIKLEAATDQSRGDVSPEEEAPKLINTPGYSGPDRRQAPDRRRAASRRRRTDKVWLDRRRKRPDRRLQLRRSEDRVAAARLNPVRLDGSRRTSGGGNK